jgi:hypothetical protein
MPLGMNSVEFKHSARIVQRPAANSVAMHVMHASSSFDDELQVASGRMNSEAVLVRPTGLVQGGATGLSSGFNAAGGRSFTAMQQPGMKKIAQGAIASKIEQYVQSHGASKS